MKFLFGILILVSGHLSFSCSSENDDDIIIDTPDIVDDSTIDTLRIDTFTFSSNGEATNGKIFLPDSFEKNQNLPAIFLIDYVEQHFETAKDEFEKVIEGVQAIEDFDALVITLEEHRSVDSKPRKFQDYYEDFKTMASYVDGKYTNNTSRTFIGRGSEGGIVLMTMFLEDSENSFFDNYIVTDPASSFSSTVIDLIENENFSKNKGNKKLHFSFSSSNDFTICGNLVNAIIVAQYPWLEFKYDQYLENNYENTYPVAFAAGLKFVFEE